MAYSWNFGTVLQYKDAFAHGFLVTAELSLLVITLALLLGTALGVSRVFFPNKAGRDAIGWLVEILRAFPKIVLIVWIFYALPVFTYIQLPAFESAAVALSLISAAFVAEIVRGGIEAIPKGQIEAAKTLGMSESRIITSIILPQVFMRNAAALMGECSTIIKDSTLAVMIGVNELLYATGNAAVLSYRPMELYTLLGLIFLAIILPLSALSKKLEFSARTRGADP